MLAVHRCRNKVERERERERKRERERAIQLAGNSAQRRMNKTPLQQINRLWILNRGVKGSDNTRGERERERESKRKGYLGFREFPQASAECVKLAGGIISLLMIFQLFWLICSFPLKKSERPFVLVIDTLTCTPKRLLGVVFFLNKLERVRYVEYNLTYSLSHSDWLIRATANQIIKITVALFCCSGINSIFQRQSW